MNGITIGTNPIGVNIAKNPVKITIGVGGTPPAPTPSFPSVTSNVFRVEDNVLTGVVTSNFTFTPYE